jgi:4-amino-4-deoxy-L-arabinose transferase-like glycosyltransferase
MTDSPARWTRPAAWELIGSALVVGGAGWYLQQFIHRGANLLDEGSQVAMANRILHGDVIYRDFLTVATPGSFYTVAWLFQIFGTDLMVLRWAVFALSLGIMIATLVAARHVMSWPFAAASALLTVVWGWFLVAPNLYSWEAMFLALVPLACYLQGVRRDGSSEVRRGGSLDPPKFAVRRGGSSDPPKASTRWLLCSGLACGAAILVKQNTGLYALAGLLTAVFLAPWLERSRRAKAASVIIAGVALVVIPVLLFLTAIGAAPYLYENWVYYPTQLYPRGLRFEYPALFPLTAKPELATFGQVLPSLLLERIEQPAGFEVWQKLVLYLPWLVYPLCALALAVAMVRRGSAATASGDHALLAITSVGAFTFLQAWPRADVTHILFGMQPAFVLFGYLGDRAWRVFDRGSRAASAIALVVLLTPQMLLLRSGYHYTLFGYQNEYVPIRAERAGGVRTSVRNAAQIDQVTDYITTHTAPQDPVFVVPWAAGLYFLTDRPNPTRFDVILYPDPDSYPCLMATLDQRQPRYVIYGYGWDVDGQRFAEYAQPIDAYIRSRYEIVERFDEFEIWRRLDNAQPMYRDTLGSCRRRMLDAGELRRLFARD